VLGLAALINAAAVPNGMFTVNCAPLTIVRSDPIISPGIPSAHVHAVIGGNNFNRSMVGTYFAINATKTTCNKAVDHSNYWVPQLYHYDTNTKMYSIVEFQGSAHYYQRRACDYAPGLTKCDPDFVPMFFPYGFRMLAGDPTRRTQNNSDPAQRAIDIVCLGGNYPEGGGFPKAPCGQFRAQVYFPSCWNGKDLDPPDHMSHMAYPAIGDFNGGVCPQSHPKALISLFYEFFFNTGAYGNDYTHFAFANGDPTGFGYHGDFIMGWTDRDAAQNAFFTCINAADCPTLGNQQPTTYPLLNPSPVENIGLNGPIAALPGNNPIDWNMVEEMRKMEAEGKQISGPQHSIHIH